MLERQKGAVVLLEQDSSGAKLYELASAILGSARERDEMARALNAMATPDAGEQIYQVLMELMGRPASAGG